MYSPEAGYEASDDSNDFTIDKRAWRKINFVKQHAQTISNAQMKPKYHKHCLQPIRIKEQKLMKKADKPQNHDNENENANNDNTNQVHNVSQNGLLSLKAFANKMAGGATKFFASPSNNGTDGLFSPSNINHFIQSIKQTNDSVNLLHRIWNKSIMALIICMALCCIFVLIPQILSLIWLALGFELVDKKHYMYTIVFFFVIWGVLSFCVCIGVLIVHCRQKPA